MSSLSPATKIKRAGTHSGEINAIRRWWRQRCLLQGGWDIFHLHDSRLWTLCTSRKFHVTVWRSDNIVICRRFESPSSYISPCFSLFLRGRYQDVDRERSGRERQTSWKVEDVASELYHCASLQAFRYGFVSPENYKLASLPSSIFSGEATNFLMNAQLASSSNYKINKALRR